jgi:hypothetical protein
MPTNKPMPVPPDVAADAKPALAWGGPGTLPIVVWVSQPATPK